MQIIKVIRNCLQYFTGKKRWLCLFIGLVLIMMVVSLFVTYLYSQVLSLFGAGAADKLPRFVFWLAGTYVISMLCNAIQFFIRERLEQNIKYDIKKNLLQRIVSIHPSVIKENDTARMTEILYSDTGSVPSMVFFVIGFSSAILEIIISAVVIYIIHPLIAGILTLFLLGWTYIVSKYSIALKKQHVLLRSKFDTHFKLSRDLVKNSKYIYASDSSAFHAKRFENNLADVRKQSIHVDVKGWVLDFCNSIYEYAWVIFFLLWGSSQLATGRFNITEMVFFLMYSRQFNQGTLSILQDYARLQQVVVSVERVFDLEKQVSEDSTWDEGNPFPCEIKSVALRNVCFSYPHTDTTVIDNLSIDLQIPSLVLVVGKNGCGKTTLLNLMTGILKPASGNILYNNTPIQSYTAGSIPKSVAYLMQDTPLFDLSVRDNLLSFASMEKVSEDELRGMCENMGILEDITALPDSFDTQISEIRDFSVGQKKKLLLARTFLQPSSIVFLDEPLAGVDDASKTRIAAYIEKLARRKTVVISTHMPERYIGQHTIVSL